MKLDSPYKGLVPFEDSDLDALLFFGRERESAIIEENVLAARLTVLYGPSGVGKTSVLRAGVAHRLRERARRNVEERGHPEFVVVVFAAWRDDDPMRSLLAAVREELASQFGSALLDERDGESLADTLGRWTDALACDLLLVLDQAEEYFLYHRSGPGFATDLPELVTRSRLRVRVLLSLRDDALAKLDRFKGQIPSLFGNYLRLDHLDRRSARDAITKPVERYNELTGESVEAEPALIDAVLEQTAAGRVDLAGAGIEAAATETSDDRIEAAYLQLVLERIWTEERRAGSGSLRAETLVRLGGAEAIVQANLRRAVEELTPREKDLAADIFRHLVTPSGAKIAHSAGDLADYASVDELQVLPVLSTLGRERIVRTVDGAGDDGARYEIFHDVLGEAVLAWRREQELDRERRAAERRHRRLAIVAVAALLALAAMTAVAIYALSQRRDARRSADRAEARELVARSSGLVARSSALVGHDPQQSIVLAAEAARLDPTAEAESALRDALAASHVRTILEAGNGRVNAAAYDPSSTLVVTADGDGTGRIFTTTGVQVAVLRHRGAVTDAAFSPDGKIVATASRDRTVKLWTRDGKLIRTLRHDAPVVDLVFSPDRGLVTTTAAGTTHIWSLGPDRAHRTIATPAPAQAVISNDGAYLAVVGADRFARVYSLPSGGLIFELQHASQVLSAAFGRRKEMLVSGSADWTAQTWDLRQGRPAYKLSGHFGRVVDVGVSPLGQFVGTASADGTARIWNVATRRGALTAIATGHADQLHSISFSSSGLFFVTSSRDGTARVWKTDRGTPVTVLAGHGGDVLGATFSRTGRRVLTYGEDGTARIWDSGTTDELRVIAHQRAAFTGLDVFAGGGLFVTTDADGIARMWRRDGSSQALPARGVRDASLSADGSLVATASADGTVRIWTVGGEPKLTLRTESSAEAVAFSPDGRTLATAGGEGVVLWRVADGARERTLRSSGETVDLSFSSDGDHLVTAGGGGKGRIWSVSSGRLEHVLVGHRDRLTSARFSPDGTLVVTASADHDARVWDARTGHMRVLLRGHQAIVQDAAFSPDGRWIVTAGPGTAGLWEVRTGRLLSFLRGHTGPLTGAEFGHGFDVFTAGEDGTVRTYACEVCAPLSGLLALANRQRESTNAGRR